MSAAPGRPEQARSEAEAEAEAPVPHRSFAERCGLLDAAYRDALDNAAAQIEAQGLELVRFGWCDLHGQVRGKTLVAPAAVRALREGVGMVGTLVLKDSADRTAYKVFERGGADAVPGFACAGNLLLMPDPASLRVLPWLERTGWLRCQPWYPDDARPVALDTRHVLQQALARLAEAGYGLRCGLEVEMHIYRLDDPSLAPQDAGWPGPAPRVTMLHPGYHMLNEVWFDRAEPALRIVQRTAQALGLPLQSLEIEFGPSQVEAVFDATDALTAADQMVLFRNAVRQALYRAGYFASFMCRPPFPEVMSSGWHLHQSLVDLASGRNAFVRERPAEGSTPAAAQHTLSAVGEHYLAGLLAHARGMAVFCTPTANGYGRFRPNALAPQSAVWGRDNRGAMLRVVGAAGDHATRIENRIGEPAANPYLYMAAQIHAGLDGLARGLAAPPATDDPYGHAATRLPASLDEALVALRADTTLVQAFGPAFVDYLVQVKQAEWLRFSQAPDREEFERREYFGRL